MSTDPNRQHESAPLQRLASAFYHDFNNLFQTALGNLDLLSRRISDPSHAELVQEAVISLERAVALTERLNLAGNKPAERLRRIGVDAAIAAAVPALRDALREGRDIAHRSGAAGVECLLLQGQLECALEALILDGPVALRGGPLTIRTAAVDLAGDGDGLADGAYVRITVSADTAAETDGRISLEDGIGALLARLFAAQLGGVCRTRETAVELFLPRAATGVGEAPADQIDRTVTDAPEDTAVAPEGKVLVVDDNPGIGGLLAEYLSGLGLRHEVAGDMAGALELFADGGDICLLVCDLELGARAGGVDLARLARARKPALPIIFISGLPMDPDDSLASEFENAHFLHKPFPAQQFRDAVRRSLAAGS